MVTSTQGWMAGALVSGPDVTGSFDGQFWYTTDGGNTWTLDAEIENFFPMDISVPGKFKLITTYVISTNFYIFQQMVLMLMHLDSLLLVLVVLLLIVHLLNCFYKIKHHPTKF